MAELLDLGKITAKSIGKIKEYVPNDTEAENDDVNMYTVHLDDDNETEIGKIKIPKAQVKVSNSGVPDGVASLDGNKLVPREQLPLAKLCESLNPPDSCKGAVKISLVGSTAHIWTD